MYYWHSCEACCLLISSFANDGFLENKPYVTMLISANGVQLTPYSACASPSKIPEISTDP